MQISPPYGYRALTPLLKTHRVAPAGEYRMPAFASTSNALPVTISEIPVAAHDYPVVFSGSNSNANFTPVAIVGITSGENLFVKDGTWLTGAYLPAYVRRYPYCMSRVSVDAVAQTQRIICIETDALRENGDALFDITGKALPEWTEKEQLLQQFEADLDRTAEMCAILADYKLLEPFTMQANFDVGGAFHLDGMFRVDEKRIEYLSAVELKNLIRKGILARIYQHLGSLTNFNRLSEIKGERLLAAAGAGQPTANPGPASVDQLTDSTQPA